MSSLLSIRSLSVRFGAVKAVDDLTFDVPEGKFVGLIGPNGAGKTTVMDAITGLVRSTGEIYFDGVPLHALAAHRRVRAGVGRTFQSLELFEDLTVRENMTAAAHPGRWWSPLVDPIRPRPSRTAGVAVNRALAALHLEDVAERLPSSLSLGARKLATVARSLAGSPRLLLLDEPAAGLDTHESEELGVSLREIVDAGTTVLIIDHDMGLVLGACDEVKVLEFGRLIAEGSPEAVRSDDRVIHAYLGAGAAGPASPESRASR
jgi:ABC-type branched-subunit amino acid transport system ATPase component